MYIAIRKHQTSKRFELPLTVALHEVDENDLCSFILIPGSRRLNSEYKKSSNIVLDAEVVLTSPDVMFRLFPVMLRHCCCN